MPALGNLFKIVGRFISRVSPRVGRGLLQMHADRYIKGVAKNIRIDNKFLRFAYEELTHEDKEVFDEMLKCTRQYVVEYIDHHDENHRHRIQMHELDDVLQSHFEEIMRAGWRTLEARFKSHRYDIRVGKPGSDNEHFLKVCFLAIESGYNDFLSADH